MANHSPNPPEKEQIEHAQKGFDTLMHFTKYGIIGVTALLLLMAATLL